MRNLLPLLALLLIGLPVRVWPQEVITNENGEKIVVDANGNWRYFRADSSGVVAKFTVPEKVAGDREKRLRAAENQEKELSLSLIKKRVEMTDLQVEIQEGKVADLMEKKAYLKLLQQKITELKAELQDTRQLRNYLKKINDLPDPAYARKLKKWENDHRPTTIDKEMAVDMPMANPTLGTVSNSFANGILILPPTRPCEMGSLTFDETTGSRRWETVPSKLFSYTDEGLVGQFIGRDFVTCTAYLIAGEGGLRFLQMEIAIASLKAPQIFGQMPKDEFLEIQLLSGEKLTLFNSLSNNGQWIPARDAFVYFSSYPLGIKEEKSLRSSDLDSIKVRWSQVQEQFEIYRTDFFIRQFNCLDAMLSIEN